MRAHVECLCPYVRVFAYTCVLGCKCVSTCMCIIFYVEVLVSINVIACKHRRICASSDTAFNSHLLYPKDNSSRIILKKYFTYT